MQRVTLFVIAVLFFLTSMASVGAIYLASKGTETTTPLASQEAVDQNACGRTSLAPVEARPAPNAFIPGDDVTSLAIVDIIDGSGAGVEADDCIAVLYYGTLATTGAKFDENYTTGAQIEFTLNGVIQGWKEGMLGMKVGGKRRLVIPSEKGYGEQGVCRTYGDDQSTCTEYSIPPNSDLVFEVELLSVR